ncbi:MAG TPA: HAD family hydrolase [Acidimicrobiales bacterium]|nr:HAD family hydrolase [Acidimicrobiales bacterium]
MIFDGDDTLWLTEQIYHHARSAAAEIAASDGVDRATFEGRQREVDVVNVKRLGLSRQRFPTSSREAYEALCRENHRTPSPEIGDAICRASSQVFSHPAAVVPEAEVVLADLQGEFGLALLTKGDPDVQRQRVVESGLASYFSVIEIVADKDERSFRELLKRMNGHPAEAWSVGNSLPSDIQPALAIGMRGVWIDVDVWLHERRPTEIADSQDLFRATDLAAARELLRGGRPR